MANGRDRGSVDALRLQYQSSKRIYRAPRVVAKHRRQRAAQQFRELLCDHIDDGLLELVPKGA